MIDARHAVIEPSGLKYEEMQPEDTVAVSQGVKKQLRPLLGMFPAGICSACRLV